MAMLNIYICTIIHHIKPMQPATNSLSDFETPPGRSISTDGPGEMDSAQNSPMDAEAMEIPMGWVYPAWFFKGKSTISMAIFNSYVKLPEFFGSVGTQLIQMIRNYIPIISQWNPLFSMGSGRWFSYITLKVVVWGSNVEMCRSNHHCVWLFD